MTVRGATLAGRRAAESLQRDRCVITREVVGVFDPATGETPALPPLGMYAGKCRLRMPTLAERASTSGEHQWTMQDSVLSLPHEATGGVRIHDKVTITACELDPEMVGAEFAVIAVLRGSQTTARRFAVREAGA